MRRAFVLSVVLLLSLSGPSAWQGFRATPASQAAGDWVRKGSLAFTPAGVNDDGVVVGSYTSFDGPTAYRYENGRTTELPFLKGTCPRAYAVGVTAAGEVVGHSCADGAPNYNTHIVVWKNGAIAKDLGVLGGSATTRTSSASGASPGGKIVGQSTIAAGEAMHTFVAVKGQVSGGLSQYGDPSTDYYGLAINDAGDIITADAVGSLDYRLNGTLVPDYHPPETLQVLTADGSVLGYPQSSGSSHPAIWHGGATSFLKDLPSNPTSLYAMSITPGGVIVGGKYESAAVGYRVAVWASATATPEWLPVEGIGYYLSPNAEWLVVKNLKTGSWELWGQGAPRKITGTILDTKGKSVARVTVTATGPESATTTTAADGTYALSVRAGSYTVTPSLGTTKFTPPSRTIDVTTADASADFQVAVFNLAGKVTKKSCTETSCTNKAFAGASIKATSPAGGGSAKTAPDGTYSIKNLRNGTHTVTPKAPGATFDPASRSVALTKNRTGVNFTGCVGAASQCLPKVLAVKLFVKPGKVDLKATGTEVTPQNVTLTVRVTNTSTKPVKFVTLQKLQIGFVEKEHAPAVPLRVKSGPTPVSLGTINPGKTARGEFVLTARGDGTFEIDELVLGQQDGKPIRGRGVTRLPVTSPLLKFTVEPVQDLSKLIKGGDSVQFLVTAENLSYVKTLITTKHYRVIPDGNAAGGGLSRTRDAPAEDSFNSCSVSPVQKLDPLQREVLSAIIYTQHSEVVAKDGGPGSGGGTRGTVTFPKPGFGIVKEGAKPTDLAPAQVVIVGDSEFALHIDDSAAPTPKSDWRAAWAYTSVGLLKGLYRFTTGVLHGVFIDLPVLVARGVLKIPSALMMYAQLSAEVGREMKANPLLALAPGGEIVAMLRVAYKHAPELLGNVATLTKQVNAAVLKKYTTIANEWYAGDWRSALEAMTAEATEGVLNAADALGLVPYMIPCVGARATQLFKAVEKTAAKLQVKTADALAPLLRKAVDAAEALRGLRRVVTTGFEFRNLELRQLMGLTEAQSNYLRKIASEHQLVITLRSRAVESIDWFKKGLATLKPEQIKTKNVNHYDTLYLGYKGDRQGNVARVAVRKPLFSELPTESATKLFAARLKRDHPNLSPREVDDVVKRFADRHKEWRKGTPSDGYPQQLLEWGEKGKIEVRWNFGENLVDPSTHTTLKQTYDFRMRVVDRAPNGDPIEWIPEVKVDGDWKSFTGDVDLVSITHANGKPLKDVEHVGIFETFRRDGIMGFMHPETATWFKNGIFNFADKIKYLIDECCYAQFGPDGVARAVRLDGAITRLEDPLNYYLHWIGGYLYPYRGPDLHIDIPRTGRSENAPALGRGFGPAPAFGY